MQKHEEKIKARAKELIRIEEGMGKVKGSWGSES